jgi:two-component SAPR family response regulator
MLTQNLRWKLLFTIVLFIQFLTINVFGQEYGLEFLGHEVVSDKRTSLVLGDEQGICFKNDFSLSFELKFKPKVTSYFGYVFRIITQDNKNIDLLFQSDAKGKKQNFRIISGDVDIKLSRQLDSVSLYSTWNHFNIKIHNNQLQFFGNDKLLGSGNLSFSFNQCFKIYFGECANPKFLTSDALPMFLRDIILKSDSKTLFHWQLKEIYGNITTDKVAHQEAITKNTQWLLKKHYEWKQLTKIRFKGNSIFSFDPSLRKIIINSDLKTYWFDTRNDSLSYKNLDLHHKKITFGDLGIFLKNKNKLINVRLNEKKIFDYNANDNSWNISPNEKYNLTEYWHSNKYIYPADSALVLIGGYGQYKYKNNFQKFSFQTNTWSDLKFKGDVLEPRYMFGLGNENTTKSYLFGGYGSKTGDQVLNPQNYYDLFEIDWKQNTVKKVYELKVSDSPFVVASSLILNEKKDSFYGLIYNQLKFNTSLQLIEGSLSKPEIKPISKEIPYQFIDVASNADLYFDKENSKLYCVTSYFDRIPVDSTEIIIYSLDFPPSNLPIVAKTTNSFVQKALEMALYGFPLLLIIFLVGTFQIRQKKGKIQKRAIQTVSLVGLPPSEKVQIEPINENITINKEEISKSKVLLFGGFQFLNDKGIDLTNHFTPLLKEMFLYLLLHSIKWNKGINSSQLNEMFWFDKTAISARNNRSVNIIKLKTIFESSAVQITKDTGNWKIVFDPAQVYIDYFEFQKLTNVKKTLNVEQINGLTEIVNRGGFLSNLEYDWLDDFKGEISNKVIDAYLAYSERLNVATHAEEIIEIADNIFKFDSVDETAMSLKCRALVHLGKHSLAKSSYEKFAKDYQRLYSEEYGTSYKEILEA